jgi:hypothetical protein
MMKAVEKVDVLFRQKILYALPINISTLMTEDANGNSLLKVALHHGLARLLSSYVYICAQDSNHLRYDLDTQMQHQLAADVKRADFEMHPQLVVNKIFSQVLTEEAHSALVGEITQEWLDSYHT